MNTGIRFARIWGIPIRMHFSWFLIFALVTGSLAVGYLPGEYPGLSRPLLWLIGGVTGVFFAASVLIHELGHSLVAIRNGVPVRSITLFFFGGVAQIRREPPTPGAEFRIAFAGPLASLMLAAFFWGLYLLDRSFPALAAPSAWLARINLLLGLFNLIPGFPLDGGRVLRAAIWQLTRDPLRATRIAANVGRVVSYGFFIYGIFLVATGRSFTGIWMLLIGWFLQNSASSAYSQAAVYQMLRGLNVSQIMGPVPALVPSGLTLDRLVRERVEAGGELAFGLEGGDAGRILTIRDIKAVPRRKWAFVTAGEALRRKSGPISIHPDMDLVEALMHMDDNRTNHAPVMADGRVVGLLTRENVMNYIRARRV